MSAITFTSRPYFHHDPLGEVDPLEESHDEPGAALFSAELKETGEPSAPPLPPPYRRRIFAYSRNNFNSYRTSASFV